MLKIQRSTDADNVRFVLSGHLEREHIAELERLIDEDAPHSRLTFDLEEIRLVDREAVGFLARCEAAGIRLENCAAYLREWIAREEDGSVHPERTTRR